MQYNNLGDTGLVVSRLALGAMTFGTGDGPLNRLDPSGAGRLVDSAIDAGINFFNTAATYGGGQSEEILGAALGSRRADSVIATKVAGPTGNALVHRGLSRRHVIEALDGSLRRLGTDYVDVYLAHHYDPSTPMEETLEALDWVVRQGKVRYLGFSNWPAWAAAKAIGIQTQNNWHRFCCSESYYSLLGRDVEHEIAPFCDDAGIAILAWSPLAMGFLTGRYPRGDARSAYGRFNTYEMVPGFDIDHGYDVVDAATDIAKAHDATPAQVSLAWLLSRGRVSSVLVGASSLEQLQDNLASVELEMTPAEMERLDGLTALTPIYPMWVRQRMSSRRGFDFLAGRSAANASRH